jgi:hypothetical protein
MELRTMTLGKSELVETVDRLQVKLRAFLKDQGFRARGRTFNRKTSDGLIQVIQIQMGSFDPPGTTYIPGLRQNLYGKFTINLGVYVPEVAEYYVSGAAGPFIQEIRCCLRARLGTLGPEKADVWWAIRQDDELDREIKLRLERDALSFFKQFGTRDAILAELQGMTTPPFAASGPPRIICAIILAKRGLTTEARSLLASQARETRNPGHPAYVRALAERLGLGALDDE